MGKSLRVVEAVVIYEDGPVGPGRMAQYIIAFGRAKKHAPGITQLSLQTLNRRLPMLRFRSPSIPSRGILAEQY